MAFRPRKLAETGVRDWLIRFGFSVVAGVVSVVAGPKVGGLFLAFPAILLASLTLVAREEGSGRARDDARGAAFGTIGMLAFAVAVGVLAQRTPDVAGLHRSRRCLAGGGTRRISHRPPRRCRQ
jgi:formate hydrogenlyase subunit 3/multisubunit Na+/H+ antiporter MnhD subunit